MWKVLSGLVFVLLPEYIRYNRKLNITLNFRFHMYEKLVESVTSHALESPPSVTNCHTFLDPSPSSVTYFMDGPQGNKKVLRQHEPRLIASTVRISKKVYDTLHPPSFQFVCVNFILLSASASVTVWLCVHYRCVAFCVSETSEPHYFAKFSHEAF